jgi:hypothetical protein
MNKRPVTVLNLHQLAEGIPALTRSLGEVHAECAAVCLEHQGHQESVELHVRGVKDVRFELSRPTVTDQMRRAHFDLQRATEYGACGVALLLAREVTGLTAIEQSRKGTGFDYWIGAADQPPSTLVFQKSARLEISGLLSATEKQFAGRIRQKLRQSEPSDKTGLPAFAIVIDFGRPQAEVAER